MIALQERCQESVEARQRRAKLIRQERQGVGGEPVRSLAHRRFRQQTTRVLQLLARRLKLLLFLEQLLTVRLHLPPLPFNGPTLLLELLLQRFQLFQPKRVFVFPVGRGLRLFLLSLGEGLLLFVQLLL